VRFAANSSLPKLSRSRKASVGAVIAVFVSVSNSGLAQSQNACDLTNDGVVNAADVNLAVNMALGLSPCTANIVGPGVCNMVVVQRVLNAASNGACVTTTPANAHSVSLSWVVSVTPNVVGYNLYRLLQPNGSYTQVNSALISGNTYTDSSVASGQSYYYVATSVDTNNVESAYSDPVQVTIPTP
jgi:hypothetical protein